MFNLIFKFRGQELEVSQTTDAQIQPANDQRLQPSITSHQYHQP